MANQTTGDLVARQEWLEPLESGLQSTVRKTFEVAGDAGRKVEDFLHGVWLGDPLHVALTDVPIGSWTAAVAMDAVESMTGNSKLAAGADAAIGVGLVGAVAAAVTGVTDWKDVEGTPRRVGLVHGLLNLSGAALFGASLIMRRRNSRNTGKILSAAGYAVMLTAAKLGGELVYRHGIGREQGYADRERPRRAA